MTQYVYLIETEGTPYTKIGLSQSPHLRIGELQTAHPQRLHLHSVLICDRPASMEAELHRHFSAHRAHGEWFCLTPGDVLSEIDVFHGITDVVSGDSWTRSFKHHRRIKNNIKDELLSIDRDLILDALTAVFGADPVHSQAELTEQEIYDRLSPFLADHLSQIQRFLDRRCDLSPDPMFVLRRILKGIGLKLARKQIMRDGQRFMVYRVIS